jgi:hypothetical protein
MVCDTSAPRGSRRMILADDHGRDLASVDGRWPPIALERKTELLALLPPSTRQSRATWMFVRCYDERGRVVARLALQ